MVPTYEEACLLISEYIHFYNNERIQLKSEPPVNWWFAQPL
ncbi:IS3 family transposase [Acetivibrio sp. MSJd-27]